MSVMDKIKLKAQSNIKRIVLPEGDEKRTVQAAAIIRDQKLAEVILLGAPDKIAATAAETKTDISGIETINPVSSPKFEAYAAALEARRARGHQRGVRLAGGAGVHFQRGVEAVASGFEEGVSAEALGAFVHAVEQFQVVGRRDEQLAANAADFEGGQGFFDGETCDDTVLSGLVLGKLQGGVHN